MTKQQRILFYILKNNPNMKLGDITYEYHNKYHVSRKRDYIYSMRKNSKMSSWLNLLSEKGLIYIDYINQTYSLTNKSIEILNNENN